MNEEQPFTQRWWDSAEYCKQLLDGYLVHETIREEAFVQMLRESHVLQHITRDRVRYALRATTKAKLVTVLLQV